ncbi:regulator of protease activity HflC (stomatin/prohibitin superfamily) [Novosphingobium sp. SG751A]|uniref:DUF4169 family protein n=1 Tax=Novosphingobium sp. SG751A TaxID=2587000 RepID=UPI001557E705|nr:DUF4169 family protein [Novosphingobium sp. SG751A]NOW46602.1 regulator of protease activity HflC (stomatin/prohibitin superfamily) [Novosphingobium sp. SG751A]
MAEIINLRMARKARARGEAEKQAQANRTLHGQTKTARAIAKADKERAERLLDGVKREEQDSPKS